ncbi:PTS system oligo-beta-mannoside-specific EIIC component [Raoultella terrigena]|nr:PTS system oligo-beta-mannoside-specific EIIC component [Raoultella terrigena]
MSSLYQSMIAVIEQSITPLAGRLGQQKYVIAIRDGFTAALPFMIIGSFMLVFIFPPFSPDTTNGFARGWLDFSQQYREQLMLPFNLSMGVMTFFISVGIGASLGRQFQLDPVMSGLLAFMAFLLVAAPYADGKISTQYLSGQGIFTALITAIYSTRVYAWLKQNNITIRLPKEVPTGVARSFEILIPVLVVIGTLHPLNLFIEAQTGMILPQAIMHLLEPLVSASDSLPAILLSVLMCQIFWFAGIHGSLIVTGIMNPFLDGEPVGKPGGTGRWRRATARLSAGLLGPLSADWRRGLDASAGIPAAAQPRGAPADHRQNGHRAKLLQH